MKSKIKPLVNLNVNPCKMCMPMGATTALYGIKECMTILHGSQGCATYIRRHMATHYNEPIDIASSSLTEEGTVYGGHKNLKKGLLNLISLYHPKVIGIMTTCLAETIGEDIEGIRDDFYEENPEYKDITIIPVHSPGYSGTQYEGYMAALCAVAEKLEMDPTPNDKVNVILPPHSPADLRFIKQEFARFGIDAIFLPDNSDNLDGGFEKQYSRLPLGGTSIEDLKKMAGARLTIEMTDVDGKLSPGKILEEKYNVPFVQINSPMGLVANDKFYKTLKEISGKEVPEQIQQQRGRYLDGMIDSHKYNNAGRAVIFGEPEFVISTVKLCEENGVMPVVAATGSVFPTLGEYVGPIMEDMAKKYFIDDYIIGDDVDFKEIEEFAIKTGANMMIGNSDGRRIEEHLDIPLVRRAFPIHDRVGGQRLRMLGYEGSLSYLDEITNAVLAKVETSFREEAYDKYFKGSVMEQNKLNKAASIDLVAEGEEVMTDIERKTKEHPCYTCGDHKYARIHLPVAPSCNVQCNYCDRKYDCVNESRPGVTSTVLTPEQALERYKAVKEKMPNLTVVGIAGPGDACGESFPQVKETLELIKEFDPEVTFCLSTNGLMLPRRANDLIELGVSHITVTMSAVDPEISGKIYKFVNYMGERYEGTAAGAIILANQLAGLQMLVDKGIICKVNIVTLKGINDHHIPAIVQKCKDMGIYITNIMPLIPVKGTAFENLPMVSNKEIMQIRKENESIMKQMYHCKQCRADAIGTLDNDVSVDLKAFFEEEKAKELAKEKAMEAVKFAVASKSGINVDLHFGKADEFYIYNFENGEVRFLEKRNVDKFCSGSEECDDHDSRIEKIVSAIEDCKVVLAMRIGSSPMMKLNDKGITAVSTFANIETAIHDTATKIV